MDRADFFRASGTLDRLFMLLRRSRNTVAMSVFIAAFKNYKFTLANHPTLPIDQKPIS